MIDWSNLEPLPRKPRDPHGRERLAAVSHTRKAAKHKGRNHWKNWERRQMARAKREAAEAGAKKAAAKYGRYIDAVRAYWRGEIDAHPAKP